VRRTGIWRKPDLVGRQAAFQAHRHQGDREHGGADGEPVERDPPDGAAPGVGEGAAEAVALSGALRGRPGDPPLAEAGGAGGRGVPGGRGVTGPSAAVVRAIETAAPAKKGAVPRAHLTAEKRPSKNSLTSDGERVCLQRGFGSKEGGDSLRDNRKTHPHHLHDRASARMTIKNTSWKNLSDDYGVI